MNNTKNKKIMELEMWIWRRVYIKWSDNVRNDKKSKKMVSKNYWECLLTNVLEGTLLSLPKHLAALLQEQPNHKRRRRKMLDDLKNREKCNNLKKYTRQIIVEARHRSSTYDNRTPWIMITELNKWCQRMFFFNSFWARSFVECPKSIVIMWLNTIRSNK